MYFVGGILQCLFRSVFGMLCWPICLCGLVLADFVCSGFYILVVLVLVDGGMYGWLLECLVARFGYLPRGRVASPDHIVLPRLE